MTQRTGIRHDESLLLSPIEHREAFGLDKRENAECRRIVRRNPDLQCQPFLDGGKGPKQLGHHQSCQHCCECYRRGARMTQYAPRQRCHHVVSEVHPVLRAVRWQKMFLVSSVHITISDGDSRRWASDLQREALVHGGIRHVV